MEREFRIVSERLMSFNYERGRDSVEWFDIQDNGIWCMLTDDCNNDQPCKYARSRGE